MSEMLLTREELFNRWKKWEVDVKEAIEDVAGLRNVVQNSSEFDPPDAAGAFRERVEALGHRRFGEGESLRRRLLELIDHTEARLLTDADSASPPTSSLPPPLT